MKFSINQSELLNALSIVQKGVSTRSTLPVLSGIYVEARGDEICLQTTDLELSIQFTATALVEEEGKTVFPGKLIVDIVKNLPDAAVHIEAAEDAAVISCDSSSFSIKCLSAEDFPGFPQVTPEQQITIPFEAFEPFKDRGSGEVDAGGELFGRQAGVFLQQAQEFEVGFVEGGGIHGIKFYGMPVEGGGLFYYCCYLMQK